MSDPELTDEELDALYELLQDEIGEFGMTRDVTPNGWVEIEKAAVRRVRTKVLEFETNL